MGLVVRSWRSFGRKNEAEETMENDDRLEEELAAAEKGRLRRLLMIVVVVLAAVGGAGFWLVVRGAEILGPDLEKIAEEGALLPEDRDPVCVGILEEVKGVTADWREREGLFEEDLFSEDQAVVDQVHETATAFRSRMALIEPQIDEAVFVDRAYRGQMKEWFSNQDHEFRLLEELSERQLQKLRGETVEERGGRWVDPPDFRDSILLTMDDNFEEFRVWVAAGGHPCGAARTE